MATDVGIRLGVDGEKEFRSALAGVNSQIKNLNSEMKTVVSSMSGMNSAEDAAAKKNDVLARSVTAVKQKISLISVEYDRAKGRLAELGTALERELNMGSTGFMIRVMSFGYKRGVPFEADIVLDMRFSSNPYYDKELRPLCGKDKAIRDYVMADKDVREFMDNVESMLYRLIPRFIEQDKRRLVVAFGCTGGRHRSVCAAEELYNRIKGRYNAVLTHRDLTIEGSDIKERTGDKS